MRRLLLVPLLLFAIGAAALTACSDDSDSTDNSDSVADTAAAATPDTAEGAAEEASHTDALDVGAMLAALDILNSAEIHHMDVMLTGDAPEIDPAWLGSLGNARTAVGVVPWPEQLHERVEDFLTESAVLEAAFREDDVVAATGVITATHTAFHVLSVEGFGLLAEHAGMGSGATDHDDDHSADDEMDMDGETKPDDGGGE